VYPDPQTSIEWRDVASERSTDTVTLHGAQRSVAALYMLGFAVECHARPSARLRAAPSPRAETATTSSSSSSQRVFAGPTCL
jgi:hypothetical protein